MIYYRDENMNNLKSNYQKINSTFKKKLLFHVGIEAGLFSELNNMMIAMCYCYMNKIQFLLYSDDANFTGGNGWNALFIPFCQQKHSKWNRYGNYRHKSHFRFRRILLPNLLFRRIIAPFMIKRIEQVDYLTQDIFDICSSDEFLNSYINWELFGMDGVVREEFAKLGKMVIDYSDGVRKEIEKIINSLYLPKEYVSIQIRGGDKIVEYEKLYDANQCFDMVLEKICKENIRIKSVFIFTDEYKNVIKLKQLSSWNVYSLTREDEKGYYNEKFNSLPWGEKRLDLVKLLAIIEICLNSDFHFGYAGSCTDDFISNVKSSKKYYSMKTNIEPRKKNIFYFVRKILKFR